MTAEEIRKLYWTEPFIPFQLTLSDGHEVVVRERGHFSISYAGRRIVVCPRIEDFEIIDLVDVAAVRMLGEPVPSVAT